MEMVTRFSQDTALYILLSVCILPPNRSARFTLTQLFCNQILTEVILDFSFPGGITKKTVSLKLPCKSFITLTYLQSITFSYAAINFIS